MYIHEIIAKLAFTDEELFLYNDTDKGVVVVFTLPPVYVVERLFNFIHNGILSSYDADDIIWEKCVKHYEGEDHLIEMVKVFITHFVFLMGVDLDPSLIPFKLNFVANNTGNVSEIIKGSIVGAELATYDQVQEYNPFRLYYSFVLSHTKRNMDISETLKKIQEMYPKNTEKKDKPIDLSKVKVPPPTPGGGGVHSHVHEIANQLKKTTDLRQPGDTRYYERVESADEARRSETYKSVFKILDMISSGQLTPEDIEKINPKMTIGGNKEIIGGKIVDDEEIAMKAPRKVKFSTNIGS